MSNMPDRLTHVEVNGKKRKIEEMIEEYVLQCEKAMTSGKRDLPKDLIKKLDEQIRDRPDQALARTSNPRKTAETTAPTPTITRPSIGTPSSIMASGSVD